MPLPHIDQAVVEAIGWSLLHFLWQGAALAAGLGVVLAVLRRAETRYVVSCAAMALMPLVAAMTLWLLWPSADRADAGSAPAGGAVLMRVDMPVEMVAAPVGPVKGSERRVLPWLVAGWCVGVAVLSLRLLVAWGYLQLLSRRGVGNLPEPWPARAAALARRVGVPRPVKFVQSLRVEVPAAIGWLRPIVLIPASALCGLTPAQLEAVLAHELAHIRRHDYLVNLLQSIIETLLFYHPAVWWVSRQIRQEREHCCDDIAASISGERRVYAEALLQLEMLRMPVLAMGASGGALLPRIERLLGRSHRTRSGAWGAAMLMLLIVGGVFVACRPQASETGSPPAERAAADPAPIVDEARASATRRERSPAYDRADLEVSQVRLERLMETAGEVEDELNEARRTYGPNHRTVQDRQQRLKALQQEIERLSQRIDELTAAQAAEREFVRLAIAPGRMTFEGTETTWADLPQLLEKIEKPSSTVLEIGFASKQMTLSQWEQAKQRAAALVREHGFEYLSDVGEQPLGSRGGMAPRQVAHLGFYHVAGAERSGTYLLSGQEVPLSSAIVAAGIPDGAELVLLRRDNTDRLFKLEELFEMKDKPVIEPGDLVFMMTEPPPPGQEREQADDLPGISIAGDVPRPGRVQLSDRMTLLRALVAAGFDPMSHREQVVRLQRQHPSGATTLHEFKVEALLQDAALDLPLQAGDEIRIMPAGEDAER